MYKKQRWASKSAISWAHSAVANLQYFLGVLVRKIANLHIFMINPQIANLQILSERILKVVSLRRFFCFVKN
jgi:hypothetical protein